MKKKLLLTTILFKLTFLFSQTLVSNLNLINDGQEDKPSLIVSNLPESCSSFIPYKENLFFLANTSDYGIEIWFHDPENETTKMLKDIVQGSQSIFTNNNFPWGIVYNNELFFYINSPNNEENGLWRTDGTEENTKLFKNFSDTISSFNVVNGVLYFETANELWKSDGTPEGTEKITELGNFSSDPFSPIEIYFSENKLLIYYTTESNESRIDLINPDLKTLTNIYLGKIPDAIRQLKNSQLVFVLNNDNNTTQGVDNLELHKVDLTNNSTTKIISFEGESFNKPIKELNNFLFLEVFSNNSFPVQTTIHKMNIDNQELTTLASNDTSRYSRFDEDFETVFYVSNNPDNTTTLISILNESNELENIVELNLTADYPSLHIQKTKENTFYFHFSNISSTSAGQSFLINTETKTSLAITEMNDVQCVAILDGYWFFEKNNEFWGSQGSNETTREIANIETRKNGSFCFNNQIGQIGSSVVFLSSEENNTQKIISFDFNTSKFSRLVNSRFENGCDVCNFPLRSAISISKNDPILKVKPGVIFKNELFFINEGRFPDAFSSTQVYKTDGTESGTSLFNDFLIGEDQTDALLELFVYNNKLYFLIRGTDKFSSTNPQAMYFKVYDGISFEKIDLTNVLSSIRPLLKSIRLETFINDNHIIFSYDNIINPNPSASGVFVIDGNSNELKSFEQKIYVDQPQIINNNFTFVSPSITNPENTSLWQLNSDNGILKVQSSLEITQPQQCFELNNNLIITTKNEQKSDNANLWSINNSSSIILKSFSFIGRGLKTDNEIFFTAVQENDSELGLWKTNGTEAETTLVKDSFKKGSQLRFLVKDSENIIYFAAATPETGSELWRTDGTKEGTKMLFDLYPGPVSSNPTAAIEVGTEIYFCATSSNELGQQIWKFDKNDETLSIVDFNADLNTNLFYPNPAIDYLSIPDNTKKVTDISLFNLSGSKILAVNSLKNNKLNISHIQNGVYLIVYTIEGKKIAQKIIKN